MAVTSKGDLGRLGGKVFTANGVTPVVISYPAITANSQVLITYQSGAITSQPFVVVKTPGVGFQVQATAGTTGVFSYRVE